MSFQHPQTPQSPSQVSPATSSEALNSSNTFTSGSTASATTLPTPAHSVNGASQQDIVMADDSPNKRKRSVEDDGDRQSKKAHTEDHKLGIEDLHVDVGAKYLLCHTPHPESLPRITEDLFEMYGLTGLAAEVAREKPNGEKNALRKTYKGHMKRLGVAGHFDVVKKPEDAPSDFMSLLSVPDLEWDVHQVKGQEIGDGLSEATLSNLGKAMTMSKGPVYKSVWDTSVLGDLAPTNGDASKGSSGKLTTPGTPLGAHAGVPIRKTNSQSANDPTRPKRNIKKRAYGDNSYEGYGDGFPDDDAGYSTGDGEGGKRRKKSGNSSPYPSGMRQQYGPGMVGA